MKPRRSLRAWNARHRGGVASVEAALGISLVFIPLLLGIIGLGMALVTANRLDDALQAAVFYAWANPGTASAWGSAGSTSVTGAQAAAAAAYGAGTPAATITVSVAFNCVSSGYLPTQPASNYTCPTGQSVATYITTTAHASVTPPGLMFPAIPLTVSGTARVQ
jgi:Flp pilus assembly protein TadG